MQNSGNKSSLSQRIVKLSRGTRTVSLFLISVAMFAIIYDFHQADAVLAKYTVLPVYILFFILMYMACALVEYISLWCERGCSFHYTRIAVHCLALMLVTFEVGYFFSSDKNVYSHLPTNSVTQALSHIVISPSNFDDARI